MTVKGSLYAKYYFELRGLFKESVFEFPLNELNTEDELKLEHRSNKYQAAFEAAV